MSTPAMIATVIVGVTVTTALLAWGMWRTCRSAERAERDPRYRRRLLIMMGMLYVTSAAFAIEQVATGKEPIQTLIGLPFGLLLAWFWLRSASRVKIPPA
jgi:CDP-diglyceride synthetase